MVCARRVRWRRLREKKKAHEINAALCIKCGKCFESLQVQRSHKKLNEKATMADKIKVTINGKDYMTEPAG